MGRVLAVVLAVFLASCGGDAPTAPSPTPTPVPTPQPAPVPTPVPPPTVATIGGTWTGRMDLKHDDGSPGYASVRVILQQSGDRVTGIWTAFSAVPVNGEVAATLTGFGVDTRLSGTMTWDSDNATGTGARCVGRMSIEGSASPPSMRWTSPIVRTTCDGVYVDVVLTLTPETPAPR